MAPRAKRSHQRLVRHKSELLEIVEEGDLEPGPAALAVVVLDPQDHGPAGRLRNTPHDERARYVTKVDVPGRGGCEPRPEALRQLADRSLESRRESGPWHGPSRRFERVLSRRRPPRAVGPPPRASASP